MALFRILPALAILTAAASAQVIPNAGKAPFRLLGSGQMSNVREQKLVVIPNQAALDRYYQRELGQPARSAPTNIDWFNYKVLAVHIGQRPTGGYRIQIQGLDEGRTNQTTLRAFEIIPSPGTMVSQVVTSPWTLVLVDNQLQNFKLSLFKKEGTGVLLPGVPGGGRPAPSCTCHCPYCCGG
jgi:hypothetical protein